ncbi:VIT domain-containing protein [Rubritalea squalenifaciens]|nr:VIT domain-containing protein [Rubritalea squalenifaciens]
MKCVFVLFLLGVSMVQAQLPSMSVVDSGRRHDLELQSLELSVDIQGRYAETVMTVAFFNDTKRNQEGEFTLPLPEGATVSNYALEVNGKMREASVVEKERAVNAYESIKRQNIDPGIVTREKGNIYRTKIFPVLPKRAKAVRIGFVHELEEVDGKLVYAFPFALKKMVENVTIRVSGDVEKVSFPSKMGRMQEDERVKFVESKRVVLDGKLEIVSKLAPEKSIRGQVGEEVYIDLVTAIPDRVLRAEASKPNTVSLFWDASVSGYRRDLKKEMQVLDALFKKLGNVDVKLTVVDLHADYQGKYEVRGGDWSQLKQQINQIDYAGVANWGAVDFKDRNADRILFVGEGALHLPLQKLSPRGVVHILDSSALADPDLPLLGLAEATGGRVMDVRAEKVAAMAEEIIKLRPRLIEVKGYFDSTYVQAEGEKLRIIGKCKTDRTDGIVLKFGYGQEVMLVETLSDAAFAQTNGEVLRKLWAQRKLAEMEREDFTTQGPTQAILKHCQQYHLVSDSTAMIVLERFEDHLRYQIPPPEPDLLEKYEQEVGSYARSRWSERFQGTVHGAQLDHGRRYNWYQKSYPWMEYQLYPRYIRVEQWTHAQASVFTKEQLADTNHQVFLKWMDEVKALVHGKDKVKSKEDLKQWMQRLEEVKESGAQLTGTPIKVPEHEFAVSVRGLVNDGKTITLDKGATLKQAIEKAGGIYDDEIGDRVAIYRNADRAIYNTVSKDYKPQQLFPGDMVVVMPPMLDGDLLLSDGFSADPFSDGGLEVTKDSTARASKRAAVEQSTLPLGVDWRAGGGDSGKAGGKLPVRRLNGVELSGKVQPVIEAKSPAGNVSDVLESGDVWQAYLNLKGTASRDVKLKVAKKLYEQKDGHKARRVLSSIYGLKSGISVQDMRAAAYHMIAMGDGKGADELLALIQVADPEDELVFYDRWLAMGRTSKLCAEQWVVNWLSCHVKFFEHWRLWRNVQAMEMTRLKFLPNEEDFYGAVAFFDSLVYPSDIRIVVCSSQVDQGAYLRVTDPAEVQATPNRVSETGGWCAAQNGLADYMVRKAMPGSYRLELGSSQPATYLVQVYTHWGRENETRQVYVVEVPGDGELHEAGQIDFGL